jgi:hypothetical protein
LIRSGDSANYILAERALLSLGPLNTQNPLASVSSLEILFFVSHMMRVAKNVFDFRSLLRMVWVSAIAQAHFGALINEIKRILTAK